MRHPSEVFLMLQNMPGLYIPVKFTLYSGQETVSEFDFNVRRSNVAVVGSVPELGSWDEDNCRKAFAIEGGFYVHYEVEVMIPANMDVEWSWIIWNSTNERILKWDPIKRKTQFGKLGGRLYTYWGQDGQVFHSATCGVEMFTEYHCSPGHSLVLTGREHQLGNWDPKKGIVASREYPLESGRWKANIILQQNSHSRFKWVVVDLKNGTTIRWEEASPRRIWVEEGDNMMQIECPWNSEYYIKNLERFYEAVDGMQLLSLASDARKREKRFGHRLPKRKPRSGRADRKSVKLSTDRVEPKPIDILVGLHPNEYPLADQEHQVIADKTPESRVPPIHSRGIMGRVGELVGLFNSRCKTAGMKKEKVIKHPVFVIPNETSQNV